LIVEKQNRCVGEKRYVEAVNKHSNIAEKGLHANLLG